MVISSVVRHLVSMHLIHREDYFAIVQPVRTINASIPFVCLAPANTVYVMTMSNSGSYLVTPVASQYSSPTPVAHSYSGHGRADILPLSTTLDLIPIQSLLHLTVYPALT